MRLLLGLFLLALPALALAADDDGFTPLFDGKSLKGWEGNEKMFRVEEGAIVAGTLKEKIPHNEFLCTEKKYGDFELRMKVKLVGEGANAGIQFRTKRISNPPNEVSGFQADMGEGWWGALYDESRRNKILAGPKKEDMAKFVKKEDWNDYTIRAEGKHIQLWVNGTKTVDYTEEDANIDPTGIIAVQIHGGPASEASYKEIRIKELDSAPGEKGAATPEDAIKRAMLALREDRLEDFASAMHPQALDKFKTMLMSIIDVAVDRDEGEGVLELIGVDDVKDAEQLDDKQFFAAFLGNMLRQAPQIKVVLGGADTEALGHILEGNTAHVVCRMNMSVGKAKASKMTVFSVRKDDSGAWAMLLTGEFEGMAEQLKSRLGDD